MGRLPITLQVSFAPHGMLLGMVSWSQCIETKYHWTLNGPMLGDSIYLWHTNQSRMQLTLLFYCWTGLCSLTISGMRKSQTRLFSHFSTVSFPQEGRSYISQMHRTQVGSKFLLFVFPCWIWYIASKIWGQNATTLNPYAHVLFTDWEASVR